MLLIKQKYFELLHKNYPKNKSLLVEYLEISL